MATSDKTQQLHVKSFFAATVKEALRLGHQELGPDALLLQAREAPPEARHLGAFEVVLGLTRQTAATISTAPDDRGRSTGAIDEALVALKAFMRTLPTASRNNLVEESLIGRGVEPAMAAEIDHAVQQRLNRGSVVQMARHGGACNWDPKLLAAAATAEISERLEIQPGLAHLTALVGPPGTGKTTTLVKLAVVEGLRAGRSVRLICADTYRVGGADQLRTFAAILGVPFQAVDTVAGLSRAIETATCCDLVLIDTPGYSSALQRELGGELGELLARRQDIDTNLVLTASTDATVLRNQAASYRSWRPSKLLFTKIDEAWSLASVFCEAIRQKMPLSYFGSGQLIPEDLETASRERVAESLVRRLPEELRAVA